MAKCKYCGAEVTIGERCTYCGSKAESWYYSVAEKTQEPKKKKAITLNAEYYRIIRKNHLQDPNHIEVGQKLYL